MRFFQQACRSHVSVWLRVLTCKMSTFVSKISLVTGKQEWVFQDSNYDYHQEVARLDLKGLSPATTDIFLHAF